MTTMTLGRAARPCAALAAALAVTLGSSAAAIAQTAATASAAPTVAAQMSKEPRALEALETMGRYLRTLKTFTLRADTTIDEVLVNGQKLQFGGTVDYRYRAPDRLRLELRSDRQHRDFIYDGKTLTMSAPRMKLYASVPAPATVGELIQVAERDFGLAMPLADLFLWGGEASGGQDLIGAAYIGPARIDGQRCDHYAFRQEGVDWQLWIRQGKSPLPCKLVITTTFEPEQPQYTALLRWDLATPPPAESFRFRPASDARRIELVRVDAAPASK
jgi:hypothetical protein